MVLVSLCLWEHKLLSASFYLKFGNRTIPSVVFLKTCVYGQRSVIQKCIC